MASWESSDKSTSQSLSILLYKNGHNNKKPKTKKRPNNGPRIRSLPAGRMHRRAPHRGAGGYRGAGPPTPRLCPAWLPTAIGLAGGCGCCVLAQPMPLRITQVPHRPLLFSHWGGTQWELSWIVPDCSFLPLSGPAG